MYAVNYYEIHDKYSLAKHIEAVQRGKRAQPTLVRRQYLDQVHSALTISICMRLASGLIECPNLCVPFLVQVLEILIVSEPFLHN